jgi:hypothetical protein
MTSFRQIGQGERRLALQAQGPAEAWTLWLASRLARSGFRVALQETDAASGRARDLEAWQRRETLRAAARLDDWFDRTSLESLFSSGDAVETSCDVAVCAGAVDALPNLISTARLGAVAIELEAHPILTRMRARLRSWSPEGPEGKLQERAAAAIRPQVAPGDDFETVWLRLLVETSLQAVEIARALAEGREVAPRAPARDEAHTVAWTDFAAYRLNGRGLRSHDTLRTGFQG